MALPNLPEAARMSMMPMYLPSEPELSETPPAGCAQVRWQCNAHTVKRVGNTHGVREQEDVGRGACPTCTGR